MTTIVGLTVRGLLGRRRTLLVLLFAAIPVLVALVARFAATLPNEGRFVAEVEDALVVGVVLPLVALVFGTSALGSEIEDGTVVYLLTKPISRSAVVLAKLLVAAGTTLVVAAGSALLSGVVVVGFGGGLGVVVAFTVGVAVGSVVYASIFLALSLVTSRALIAGLGYVLIWEGFVADLFGGTRVLSVRQYALNIAGSLGSVDGYSFPADLGPATALGMAVLVVAVAVTIAIRRLQRFEIREAT